MKGPFKLKYNKSSFPFKEEEGNAIVAAAASANEPIERGESVAASFLSGFAGGLSQSKKKDKKKDKDKEKPKKRKKNIAYDPKQNTRKPVTKSPNPDRKKEVEIKKKKPGRYDVYREPDLPKNPYA
tara:strand:- start:595 stop:972 length:378 start_codon:yes stop_codon:yes gene_type:complete